MVSEVPRRELRADTRQLLGVVVDALQDKKAEDIDVLNIGAVSSLCDLFVLASGSNTRHVATLVDTVRERARDLGLKPFGVEGERTGWALIDFGDIVVHVFDRDQRDYYDLERLWLDAPRVDLEHLAPIHAVS